MPRGVSGISWPRLQVVLLVVLIALVAVIGTILTVQRHRPSSAAASMPAAAPARKPGAPAMTVVAAIEHAAAKLAGAPRSHASIYAEALAVRAEIRHGDFSAAAATIEQNLRRSRVRDWHFAPFADFVSDVAMSSDAAFFDRLNEWVAKDPHSAAAPLVRAIYYYNLGSEARGGLVDSEVMPAHMRAFDADMNHALADDARAMTLDPFDPYAYFVLMEILAANGNGTDIAMAFQKGIVAFPHYYPLYRQRLYSLEPKWGGSVASMYAFVDRYAGKAAKYSPMKMLYLDLFDDLLDAAHFDCYKQNGDAFVTCMDDAMHRLVTPALEQNAYAVIRMYGHVDATQFVPELGWELEGMDSRRGTQRYASGFLQLAASEIGSDNTISSGGRGKGNYMIDEATGLVWAQQKEYQNAETFYQRAIADLPHGRFGNRTGRDAELAQLYEDFANVYSDDRDYRKAIVYDEAADEVAGGTGAGYANLACEGFYWLHLYRQAIADCTQKYEKEGGGLTAIFWRAASYDAMHRYPAALRDYWRVADSENHYRGNAAIDMSVVYGRLHEMRKQLHELNALPYLYDPDIENAQSIAIAYNNRCYAEMQLKMLHRALADCTRSLKYGNLPDAYAKQQKLIELLNNRN